MVLLLETEYVMHVHLQVKTHLTLHIDLYTRLHTYCFL